MSFDIQEAGEAVRGVPLPDSGQRVSIESPRHVDKLWTQMVGFKPGGYLVLEKPPGVDPADSKRALRDGDSLVIRFLKDGSIFGFRTPVLATLMFPYKLLFVGYPVQVVRHSLRSSPRLQCYLPCTGSVGEREFSRAFIRDFSATGCQLRIPLDALIEDELEERLEEATDAADDANGHAAPHAAVAETDGHEELEAIEGAGAHDPNAENRILLNMQLPGDDEIRVAEGDVVDWQSLPRYHQLRVKFDELQTELFEQLSIYTTQLE